MGKIDFLDYKLRERSVVNLLFRAVDGARLPLSGATGEIARYVRRHPGISIGDIAANVPLPEAEGYEQMRAHVVRLVDAGVLEAYAELPLEEVDERYERIASCEVCGAPSDGAPVVLWKYDTPVVRCANCGLLYANPRWKAEHLFGRYTTDYWETYEEKQAGRQNDAEANQERNAYYLWTLEPVFSNGRLLDVGCATGNFLVAAKEKGWQVHGVETSPLSARIAQEATGGEIHVGVLDTAPWPDGYFDAITMFDVIEHLQSPRAYIERIARMLRPGGFLAINTPNIRSLSYRMLGSRWSVVGPNDHIYYFEPRTAQRLLTGCGFDIHLIRSETTDIQVWEQAIRFKPLARAMCKLATPPVTRLMLGDAFYMVARRKEA